MTVFCKFCIWHFCFGICFVKSVCHLAAVKAAVAVAANLKAVSTAEEVERGESDGNTMAGGCLRSLADFSKFYEF